MVYKNGFVYKINELLYRFNVNSKKKKKKIYLEENKWNPQKLFQ